MVRLVRTATQFALSPTLAANEMVFKRRAAGLSVLHMGFGESPFPVPEKMKKTLAAGAGRKEYLPTVGEEKLRVAVSDYYKVKAGFDTSKFDVIIAPGSKLILYSLQMAVEGDVLLPDPSWVSYAPQAKMLHTTPIRVPTSLDEEGFHISPEVLRATITGARAAGQNPTKIVINLPSNPTGLTMPENEMKEVAKVCVEEDILIISDEIYGFVNFEGQYRTFSKYAPSHTAVTTGLSKHLSLGGWRLGVGFIPKHVDGLFRLLGNIASETWSCVAAPITEAAVDAYKNDPEIEAHIQQCTDIHKLMNQYISKHLRAAGLLAPTAQGAFYNYPNFSPIAAGLKKLGVTTSTQLSQKLIEDYGLVSLPGVAFGAPPETLALRLSGCDYNGAKALQAYQGGKKLDEAFIHEFAPNIIAQMKAFKDLSQKTV